MCLRQIISVGLGNRDAATSRIKILNTLIGLLLFWTFRPYRFAQLFRILGVSLSQFKDSREKVTAQLDDKHHLAERDQPRCRQITHQLC